MSDWVSIVSTCVSTLAAGGWFMSHRLRKQSDEKHAVELEHAKAESDALRQRTELDYTKEVLEIYSAHIVQPLKDQIDLTNKRLDLYENAINKALVCKLFPGCPVIMRLQKQKQNDPATN